MTSVVPARLARAASGLPGVETLAAPDRVQVVRDLARAAQGNALLDGLVALVATTTGATAAQLSLVSDAQVAVSVWPAGGPPAVHVPLEQSMCSLVVVSSDVVVAADTQAHPWLTDLPAVTDGVVGAYLGAPLTLADGLGVGALCVWEPAARSWSAWDVEQVCAIADLVTHELRRLAETARPAP